MCAHARAAITAVTLVWWRKEGDAFRATYSEQQQPKQGRTARLQRMAQAVPPSAPTSGKAAHGKAARAKAPAVPAQQLDLVDAIAAQKAGGGPRGAK